jgi:arabinose-5-phosphate isomerase
MSWRQSEGAAQTMTTVIENAREVLKIEAQSITALMERIGPAFENAVDTIMKAKGRVILTGMGKSGLVARKISATLNSTGTPSLFLHPAEAIHGDLGMVTSRDIVLALSNSGETSEIKTLLPLLKQIGARIIAFTGRVGSTMGQLSDIVIDVGVEREACPMGLAPTASTTAALAMGDALAVALISRRRFNQQDFKRFHPGGSLGERLSIKVSEVMLTGDYIPAVSIESSAREAIEEINAKRIGATLVVDGEQHVSGIITDGDLRRALLHHSSIQDMKVDELMSPSPRTIDQEQTAAEALAMMEMHGITHLVITDRQNRLNGIVHLHDLLGREEFRVNGGPHPSAECDSSSSSL